ncbi:Crp/Fnr family transcriptional regulator [Neosynechococcus sphagnicola sy1]|uniref:Crp/Fnr family transcriptional regulator n=1 Tax=Neosynechococcus sphagnicola sy1 TaxID=1497020 RepID=A0A098TK70_9CYAN|nr:Crp/Fnr family transcriptional regulator [Neosynechococcus sphagnicola sy1]
MAAEHRKVHRRFARRSLLPALPSNLLWKIEVGVVRTLTWLEDGTVITLGLWTAGDIVGDVLSRIDPYQIECLTAVEVELLTVDYWSQEIGGLISHHQQTEELMLIRSSKRVDEMILKILLWLGQKFGRAVEEGRLIDLRLTHQHLAELLGTTRVTVTRALNQFEQEGLIKRLPSHLIILPEQEIWSYEI